MILLQQKLAKSCLLQNTQYSQQKNCTNYKGFSPNCNASGEKKMTLEESLFHRDLLNAKQHQELSILSRTSACSGEQKKSHKKYWLSLLTIIAVVSDWTICRRLKVEGLMCHCPANHHNWSVEDWEKTKWLGWWDRACKKKSWRISCFPKWQIGQKMSRTLYLCKMLQLPIQKKMLWFTWNRKKLMHCHGQVTHLTWAGKARDQKTTNN